MISSFVITGFLGVGKTTMLTNSVKQYFPDKKIAIVVNEFGEIGVDSIREIIEWSNIKAELRPKMAFGDQDVNEHQLTAMKKRFQFEASLVGPNTPPADARNILGLKVSSDRTQQKDVKNDKLLSVRPRLVR